MSRAIPVAVLDAFAALTEVRDVLDSYEKAGAVLDARWVAHRAKSLDTLSQEAAEVAEQIRSMATGDLS